VGRVDRSLIEWKTILTADVESIFVKDRFVQKMAPAAVDRKVASDGAVGQHAATANVAPCVLADPALSETCMHHAVMRCPL